MDMGEKNVEMIQLDYIGQVARTVKHKVYEKRGDGGKNIKGRGRTRGRNKRIKL